MSPAALTALLAMAGERFRPFMEPIPEQAVWPLLMIPLAIAIAVVYKAVKMQQLDCLGREVTRLSFQIVAFMAMSGMLLYLLVALVT